MAYLSHKLAGWGVISADREMQFLSAWDQTQALTEVAVRWGFVPGVILLAAVQTEVPLWAILSPV